MTASAVPAGRRLLTRAHITFYRAVMEGVEPRVAWSSYMALDDDYSEALCDATLGWVRQALITQALAAGEPGLIGLFRRDPRQLRGSSAPTLAEFAERFSDAGDFSEAELTEMWKEEYGGRTTRAEERRARLAKRLRDALTLVERAVKREPTPEDSVSAWLAPRLAERLLAAGIRTLGEAKASLKARKSHRWEAVPGVGEVWADRLASWLDEHGVASSGALVVAAPRELLPLELLPDEETSLALAPLAGPGGALVAAPPNFLKARSDKHAIELWLQAKATNPNTFRSYRKNAERLLLWCLKEHRVSFQQLTVEDCIHYRTWLKDLGRKTPEQWAQAGWRWPAEDWIGPRAAKRGSEEWRPFDGPLSPASVDQELLVVTALFTFLLNGGYVSHHPWKLLGKPQRTPDAKIVDAREQFVERSLDEEQWRYIRAGLDPNAGDRPARLLLVLWLGGVCGLRAAEMLSLTIGSIVPRTTGWRLRVLGKGSKTRTIPLPSPARQACLEYLEWMGYDFETVRTMAEERSEAPLLRAQRGRRSGNRPPPSSPLSYPTLYKDLKAYLARRAEDLEAEDKAAAAKFRAASTHWLRHTFATMALRQGLALPSVQRMLGHANLTTTSGYVTAEQEALQADMERFAAQAAKGG